jgi:hypothetical protein
MGRRGECWERHSRRQVPPHQPARRGFVRGVSLSVGDDAWTGRRRRQFVGRRRCLVGAAMSSVHRGAEERRHGRDTRTAAISAAQLASRAPQWSFMAADYQTSDRRIKTVGVGPRFLEQPTSAFRDRRRWIAGVFRVGMFSTGHDADRRDRWIIDRRVSKPLRGASTLAARTDEDKLHSKGHGGIFAGDGHRAPP